MDRTIAFYLSPIGSAAASQCLPEANWLIGSDRFVMFGSCGSPAYEKTAGRFVIPTEAYRNEGIPCHYAPPADYITVKKQPGRKKVPEEIGAPYMSKGRPGRPMLC